MGREPEFGLQTLEIFDRDSWGTSLETLQFLRSASEERIRFLGERDTVTNWSVGLAPKDFRSAGRRKEENKREKILI